MTVSYKNYTEARAVASGLVDQDTYIIAGDFGNELWCYDAGDTSTDDGINYLEPAQGGAFSRKVPNKSFTLANSTAVTAVLAGMNRSSSIWWNPVSGDTVQVRYKVSVDGPWVTLGSYTTYGHDAFIAPVYIVEFQRTAGSGTTSTCGVA